jgi:hypothetical protein
MLSRMQSITTMPPRSTWPMASVYESPPIEPPEGSVKATYVCLGS